MAIVCGEESDFFNIAIRIGIVVFIFLMIYYILFSKKQEG